MFSLLTIAILSSVIVLLDRVDHAHGPKPAPREKAAAIAPADYLAALLINEVPFPGEPAFKDADDSKSAMRAIVWTVHCRRGEPPEGYTRNEIAATRSTRLVDILTAANQMDGFYKTADNRHAYAPRVKERIDYLRRLARRDDTPTISELLEFAENAARDYVENNAPPLPKPFADLALLPGDAEVTGSPYGWMTDDPAWHPGGNFVRIPDELGGSLGGNRFFTLRKTPLPPRAETLEPATPEL